MGARARWIPTSPPQARMKQIHGNLQAPLIGCSSQEFCYKFKTMASTDHNFVFPPLINSTFPPQVAEPCSRTITGSRCWLLSCMDVGNGYHFSQTIHCKLNNSHNPFVFPLNSHSSPRNSSTSPSVSSEINIVIARIQHRMHSRRGGSHGGSICPPTTPSLNLLLPPLLHPIRIPMAPSPADTQTHAVVEGSLSSMVIAE